MSEETLNVEGQPVQEPQVEDTPVKDDKKGLLKKDKNKAKIKELEGKVEELEAKVAKDRDDYIRLMAEFDNFRRRTAQEKLEIVSMASTETIKGMLPVLDDCERALQVLGQSDDSDAAKEGTELIYHKLMSYLQSKGLAVIIFTRDSQELNIVRTAGHHKTTGSKHIVLFSAQHGNLPLKANSFAVILLRFFRDIPVP